MCPPASAPVPDLSHDCSDEELFGSLENFVCGGPLPKNVMPDVDPHDYKPENLPVGLWYFIVLKSLRGKEHGVWRATGERSRIFSNESICGWKTTYQFCDQQSLNMSRVYWLMEEYTITQNGIDIKTIGKATNALCRVHRNDPSSNESDLKLGHGPADILVGRPGNSADSHDFRYCTRGIEASSSNHQVNNIEAAAEVAVARDNPVNQENMPDADWEEFPRDFLEEDDLDMPVSPSSSSSNSSCLTMSSDQCFDSLLKDIENEIVQDMEKKGANHQFNVASVKPDGITSYLVLPGSSIRRAEGEIPTSRNEFPCSLPALISTAKTAGKNLLNEGIAGGKQNLANNLTALARATIASSSTAQPSTTPAMAEGRNRARGGIKMLKGLLFNPFQCHLPLNPGNRRSARSG